MEQQSVDEWNRKQAALKQQERQRREEKEKLEEEKWFQFNKPRGSNRADERPLNNKNWADLPPQPKNGV